MFTILLDRTAKEPVYEQLYRFIRGQIEEGKLPAGEKLPSKRQLAAHLSISQITVQNAYAQLVAEGYLQARPKSGYYVEAFENPKCLSRETAASVPVFHRELPQYTLDFKTNAVDTSLFPFSVWSRIGRQVLKDNREGILTPSPPQGLLELRREIAAYLLHFRGMQAAPEQIILGAGTEYLLSVLVRLLGEKSVYAVENPGYYKISRILEDNQAAIRPIPLDDWGMSELHLRQCGANIAHITPSHQFPTGTVMPVRRRYALLNWASEQAGRYIIESDYDSEFRFAGNPIPALQGLDRNDKVIYINTFTRSLAPSLRISYMVLPPALLRRYQEKYLYYSCTVPVLDQSILYEFIRGGYWERHLSRMCKAYREKRDVLVSALRQSRLGKSITLFAQDAGPHLLLQVAGRTGQELVEKAKKAGIRVYGISEYYLTPPPQPSEQIVLGYTGLKTEAIPAAVESLIKAWS